MTFDQIISDLKKKIYRPVYFLQGEEPYYIDQLITFIEKRIQPDSRLWKRDRHSHAYQLCPKISNDEQSPGNHRERGAGYEIDFFQIERR